MAPPSRKKANKPLGRIVDRLKRAKHDIVARIHSEEPRASSSTPSHTSSHVNEQPNDVSITDHHIEHSSQPASPMKEYIPDVAEPSPSAATTRFQPTGTNVEVPTEQLTTQYQDPGHTLALEQAHQGPSREAPPKTGLKKVVTGLAGQAASALNIGPFKDISDLLRGFADIYIVEGGVKKEYEALKLQLETLLEDLEKHFDGCLSPTMTPGMKSLRKSIEEEVDWLKSKQRGKRHQRHLEEAKDEADELLAGYRRIEGYLEPPATVNSIISSW